MVSKGQDSYLKWLSGTLEYHILTKGDFEVSNLIISRKGDESSWSINLLYVV